MDKKLAVKIDTAAATNQVEPTIKFAFQSDSAKNNRQD